MDPREPTSQEVDNSNAIRGQPWQCPQPANPIGEGISAANLIPAANSGRCSKCHELGRQVKYCTSANGTVKCDAAQSRDPGAHISHPKMGSQTHGSEGGDYSNALRGQPLQSFQSENPIGGSRPAASSDRCFRCRELGHWAKHCPLINARVQFNADQAGYPSASNSQPRMDHQTPTSEGDYSNALRGQPLQSFQSENPIGESRPAASSDRCFRCRELGHWAKHCPLINARVQFNADQAGYPSASNSQPRMDHQTPTSEGDYSNALRGQPLQSFQSENPIGESRPAASSDRCFRCRELGHWAKHCPLINARVQFNADQAGYPSASNSQRRMDHQTPTSEGDYSNALRGQPLQSFQSENPIGESRPAASSDRCFRCRELGHWAKHCPLINARVQFNVDQAGYPSASNSQPRMDHQTPTSEGDYSNALRGQPCQSLQPGNPIDGGNLAEKSDRCYKCREFGHWAKDCPGKGAAQCKFFQWCDEPVSSLRQNCPGGGGEFRRQSTTPTQISPVAAGEGFRGQSAISTQSSPVTAGEFRGQPANSTQKSLPEGFRGQAINPTQNSPAGGRWFRGQRPTPSINSNVESIVNGYDYSKKCPCGAGPCPVRRVRTDKNKNMGRWFVTCPVRKGEGSCGFFEWREDLVSTNIPLPDTANDFTPKHEGGNSGRNGALPCFNCGKEGHWKKDCPQLKGYLNS